MERVEEREFVVTDRVAAVTAALLDNAEGLTIVDAMRLTGLGWSGAYRLLNRLCRVLPLYTERGRDWRGRYREVRFFHMHATAKRRG